MPRRPLLYVLALAVGPCLPVLAALSPFSLRVLSFNVLSGGGAEARAVGFDDRDFGGSRRAVVAQVIRESGADIVCVQEDDPGGKLLAMLGGGWQRRGTIYAKFPLAAVETSAWFCVASAEVAPSQRVMIVNAHWRPGTDGTDLIRRRLMTGSLPSSPAELEAEVLRAADGTEGPRGYRRTVQAVRALLAKDERVILAGDFNEPSHLDWTQRAAQEGMDRLVKNPTVTPLRFRIAWRGSILLEKEGLRDAYRTVHTDEVARPGNTWTPPYPNGTPGRRNWDDQVLVRIDRIYFGGPGLEAVSAGVVGESAATSDVVFDGRWPSDHRAVCATFRITPRDAHRRPVIADSAFCRSLEYAGIALQEPGWHVWGCSPIVGEDGRVHLFVERWPVKGPICPRGFDEAWRHDAEIAHYVGDDPGGPFRLRDIALKGTGRDTWDRYAPANPLIVRVDGRYALFYIANLIGVTQGVGAHPRTQRIGLALSDSPDGPWVKVGKDGKVLDPSDDPAHWTHGAQVVNPAFVKRPDGLCMLYFKGRGANMGVAVSDRLEGPYRHRPGKLSSNEARVEDGYAFLWNGKVCLLTTDNIGAYVRGGGLLWQSDDGLTFDPAVQCGFHPPSRYLPDVALALRRSYYGAGTFQRPQVLMQSGQPTHLYAASGTGISGNDGTVCYVLRRGPPQSGVAPSSPREETRRP